MNYLSELDIFATKEEILQGSLITSLQLCCYPNGKILNHEKIQGIG
jgi:hypothetical protein